MADADCTPDTDTLLAMLISVLKGPVPSEHVLMDALVEANGDVERAALRLSASNEQTRPLKRKQPQNLTDWLQRPRSAKAAKTSTSREGEDEDEEQPVASTSATVASGSPVRRDTSARRSPISLPAPVSPRKSAFNTLRAPSSSKSVVRLQPLTLSTPSLVAQHTPCTMHLNVLPPALACSLFHAMVQESTDWTRNQWYMFDRMVESPHKTSFFVRHKDRAEGDRSYEETAGLWYNNGQHGPPKDFLPEMEEACEIIERIVSEQFALRDRYPLEWGGRTTNNHLWRANFAGSNCYTGRNESVGFHSDQLTYLGPYATIASLSLGTTRTFRLREVIPKEEASTRQAQTFNIPVQHNSLVIMHATCQEFFKHCVPPQPALDVFHPPFPAQPGAANEPSNIRINLTFRFYRPDFHPSSIPRCKCDVPMILRPDMKGRPRKGAEQRREIKYWWTCYAPVQRDGKGCGMWKVMDARAEGRGPFVQDTAS